MYSRFFFIVSTLMLLLPTHSFAIRALDNAQIIQWLYQDKGPIIDGRDPNFYNGWPSPGSAHGGHLPGATNLTLNWLQDSLKTNSLIFSSRNIQLNQPILIYAENIAQAKSLAKRFVELGFDTRHIYIYAHPFSHWLDDASLPRERLDRYDWLVSPAWLKDRLALSKEKRPLVFEVSWGLGIDYQLGHIPGAIHMNTGNYESKPDWDLYTSEQLAKNFSQLGVQLDRTIVLYGKPMETASRALFALRMLGAEDIRLLNGGYGAWKDADFPVELGMSKPTAVPSIGKVHLDRSEYIDTKALKKQLKHADVRLVSTRSWPEYLGEITGYSYIKAKGHIPGAIWGHAGTNKDNMADYLNPDGTLRTDDYIHNAWTQVGLTPDKRLIFYCGTGWRASLGWFYAKLLGFPRASLYDDGWLVWSRDSKNPVRFGPLPDAPTASAETK